MLILLTISFPTHFNWACEAWHKGLPWWHRVSCHHDPGMTSMWHEGQIPLCIYTPTDQGISGIVNLGSQDESPFNALGLILQTRRAGELESDVLILC